MKVTVEYDLSCPLDKTAWTETINASDLFLVLSGIIKRLRGDETVSNARLLSWIESDLINRGVDLFDVED